MGLLAPWLAFPVVLLALCLGAGLLVERLGGHRLPGALLLPLGFAALVAVAQLTTWKGATAPATVPVLIVLALAGFALARDRLREARPERWTTGMALAIYAMFAAPALLLGSRTFLGYGNLGDAAIHFELVDRLLGHGRSVDGLPPSSYSFSLSTYFDTAYPTGGHAVLASVRALVGVDVAWLFQPFLSVLAVLLALGLRPLAGELTRDRRVAALVAGLAAGAGLVYAYAVAQEAIKELAAAVILALLGSLVPVLLRTAPSWRAAIPLAVAAGGGIGVLKLALGPWLAPLLLVAAGVLVARHWRARRGPLLAEIGAFAAIGLVLAIPTLTQLNTFVTVASDVLTDVQEFGNLQRPLDFLQGFGVWPVSDFRIGASPSGGLAVAVTGAVLVAAAFGVVAIVRRGAWGVALFVAVSLVGFLVVAGSASPWAYGKALMILSPALALLAAAGAAGLWEGGRRAEGALLAIALVAGVGWTNALTYHAVDVAPEDRLGELAEIGERFDGDGPSVYLEFDEYAKHFLHETDPTGVAESFRPPWPEAEVGTGPRFGFSSDIGDWSPASLAEHFGLIVLRQGPTQSRPPAGWTRAFHGDFYDVWRRDADAPAVLAQLRLGGRFDAAAVPSCSALAGLAEQARAAGGRLAYAERPATLAFRTTSFGVPGNWSVDGSDPETFRPVGPGRVSGSVDVRAAGDYGVWFEASVGRAAAVSIDGRRVGALEDHINPRLSSQRVGSVRLEAGRHRVDVEVEGGDLEPGNGGRNRLIGPVLLTPAADPGDVAVKTADPDDYRALCGLRLDWVQALAPA